MFNNEIEKCIDVDKVFGKDVYVKGVMGLVRKVSRVRWNCSAAFKSCRFIGY